MQTDVIVIGAGTVGAAIAYGLVDRGLRVIVLDGSDTDHRAARANFGLVWLQGKGVTMPEYHTLTRRSVDLWPGFHDQLTRLVGGWIDYERNGGLAFCLGETAFDERRHELQRLHTMLGGDPDWEMLDRAALRKLLPKVELGPEVAGASFGHHDGHVNPLKLLASLHEAVRRLGGTIRPNTPAQTITVQDGTFVVASGDERFEAGRVVVSAGLGSAVLARQVGVEVPLRPQRGQILVTERIEPLLPLPASGLRQTAEGTLMIGVTQEETGYDAGTTAEAAARMSRDALRKVPRLGELRMVRQWAGLRVMTPDGFPVYAQSPSHPGAFVALCHSGVTLAGLHADVVADAVAAGSLPASLDMFHPGRFDVPHAA
ncbi:MAG TPA: FAD-dependent oxidoreductase [Stellaceae bacterium]|nr:FAD-dependent oxidoreductase [Stellaceae bacterium]